MGIEMSWICPKCGRIAPYEKKTVCEDCGTPLVCTQVSADEARSYMKVDNGAKFNKWVEEMKQKYVIDYEKKVEANSSSKDGGQYIPKCPTCGSPNIRPTDALEAAYNPQAHHSKTAFKSFVCRNCGYAW